MSEPSQRNRSSAGPGTDVENRAMVASQSYHLRRGGSYFATLNGRDCSPFPKSLWP
jgi:hypothetical protein